MPTYEWAERFRRDLQKLTAEAQRRFRDTIRDEFVQDLASGRGFRPGLRVKPVQGTPGVWEMTWAPDGRATLSYGPEERYGEPHIIWRRVGTHEVFRAP